MTTPLPPATFAPPATPFLASSPETAGGASAPSRSAALFGAPLDLTETFRSGSHGGPAAVRAVSDALESYSPILDQDLADISLVDLGDVLLDGASMDAALTAIEDAAGYAASIASLAIMIGGEHTASLGGFRGIRRVHPEAALLHVDAHLDIRPSYEGTPLTHASWLYHAGQQFGFDRIYQVGLRSGERQEWRFARAHTALCTPELALPEPTRRALQTRPVYVTLDIDVLDPAFAPGTGCPEPGGVSFRELAAFLYSLRGLRVVGLDVMEVSPNVDPAGVAAVGAAKLIREAALLFAATSARQA